MPLFTELLEEYLAAKREYEDAYAREEDRYHGQYSLEEIVRDERARFEVARNRLNRAVPIPVGFDE